MSLLELLKDPFLKEGRERSSLSAEGPKNGSHSKENQNGVELKAACTKIVVRGLNGDMHKMQMPSASMMIPLEPTLPFLESLPVLAKRMQCCLLKRSTGNIGD